MLAGHYPGDEFAELRPRVVWDRAAGTVESRRDARTVAVISGGTIPDRGLFGVYLADDDADAAAGPGTKAGRRAAAAGASASWTRRWSTRRARARSSCSAPAPGASSRSPTTACSCRPRPASRARCRSGRAMAPGRPVELGRALGAFTREIADEAADGSRGRKQAEKRLRERARPRRARRAQPARLPRRGAGGHGRAADRPDDRPAALPRRARATGGSAS